MYHHRSRSKRRRAGCLRARLLRFICDDDIGRPVRREWPAESINGEWRPRRRRPLKRTDAAEECRRDESRVGLRRRLHKSATVRASPTNCPLTPLVVDLSDGRP
uniref:Uncharacterized protein n=1 Tax=Plectus sambesii TaxID=2011161 RepID=A0A914WQF1_9BILA